MEQDGRNKAIRNKGKDVLRLQKLKGKTSEHGDQGKCWNRDKQFWRKELRVY